MASKRIIYLEPFSGISGDMLLGAFLDLGFDIAKLRATLDRMPLGGYGISVSSCFRAGVRAAKFDVSVDGHDHDHGHEHGHHGTEHQHRTFRDIRGLIEASELTGWVKKMATGAFRRLAEAEGKIHGQPPDEVHFHEVGAIDSIVDIVGTMVAVEEFMPARFVSAAVNVGQGTVECRHGIYPVPAPAAAELLKHVPIYSNEMQGELTTPTGAVLLASLVQEFGPRPPMKIQASGYGAGSRDIPGAANVLRITLGEEAREDVTAAKADETVAVIEASIDDMNPQFFGYFHERAMAAGALDVYATPIQMKKNRPAVQVTVVCSPGRLEAMSDLVFGETTTIGLRFYFASRKTLERRVFKVQTAYGPVAIKASYLRGKRVNFTPEYESCRSLAQNKGVALKEVCGAAGRAYLELEAEGGTPASD